MKKKDISIVKILREVIVDYMNHEIYSSLYDFNFIFNSIPSSAMVYGDEKLLERAFRNLILNSMKHNPKGCQIQIEITMVTGEVNIDISDNGIGASEEKLKLLNYSVTELIRGNAKTEKSHGLGLLIVKQIIELHNGSVNFKSIENHGFKTRITLPLYKS
jgi:signal transduction histidine kinase